jgi:predicted permease
VALGRPLARGERNAVVLMHRFWQNRLSGNPDVLGRALVLDGQAYTVVGILPPNHRTLVGFGFAPDMYVPDPAEPPPPSATGAPGREEIMSFYARLPDGMTRAAAAARLRAAGEELDRIFPRVDRKWSRDVQVVAVSGLERIRSLPVMMPVTAFFAMLMMLVGLVLLIACGNVASLLVARASSRAQELAVRLSIGASRGRIFRQLLVETLLVSFLGAGAGLLLNAAATGLFNRVRFPLTIPVQLQIHMDWRLLAYSVFIAVGSALVSGLMPSLRAARADVNAVLKRHEGQVGRRHWNLRSALVVGQLAISMVLLVAALLFLRNLGKVTSMNPGFDVDHTAWAYMRLIPASYPNEEKTEAFVTAALERVRALPGVESAAIARSVPLNSNTTLAAYVSVDAKDAQRKHLQFAYNLVSPDYFRTMGIKILAGREFLLTDRPGTPRIAIINESFANLAFAGENAVGRTIRLGDDRAIMVVGVARNSKYFMLGEENRPAMYQAYFQRPFRTADMQFLVRASASPVSIVKSLNSALSNLDPTAAVEVKPMREALAMALFPGQASAVLLGSIGLLGLALASIGLYGVLLYAVSHRIREIGLRVALGASPSNVLRMVFRDSFALVAIGAALGLGLAALATRPLSMFLVPEQSTTDPAAFAGVLGVLSAVTLIATLAPASRALRVDPITALRYE